MTMVAGLGMMMVAMTLILFGLLSRRLGRVTRATGHYRLFFIASGLVIIGAMARFYVAIGQLPPIEGVMWVLIYNGAPALGISLAVVVAWYYWSWLLAERD